MAFLLDDIFLAPFKGIAWIAEKIAEQADRELNDKSRIQEELLELQMRFELGELEEQEFVEKETQLMERLDAIEGLERKG